MFDPRQQGLLAAPVMPQSGPSGFMGQGPARGAAPLNQIYGLLAQYGDDPMQAGQGYVNAVQTQQQIDRQNQPIEQYLRLYGSVNPFDFETDSLAAFHDNFTRTGQLDFKLLQRKETSKSQEYLHEAINGAYQAENDLGRMNSLANRFDEAARQGVAQGRLVGGFNEWLKGMLGTENDVTQLRTEYEQLRISNVVQNLPPGVASDKDVALVLKGWPGSNADPAYISAFLRGMQKLRAIKLAQDTHRAGYLSRTNNEEGMLDDWNRNKLSLVDQAFQNYGLRVWNPGDDVAPEDAARMRWEQQYSTQPGSGGFQLVQPQPGSNAAPGSREAAQSFEDKYLR